MRLRREHADPHRVHRHRTAAVGGGGRGLDSAHLFQERTAVPDRRGTGTGGRRRPAPGRTRGALPPPSISRASPGTRDWRPRRPIDCRARWAGRAQLPPRHTISRTPSKPRTRSRGAAQPRRPVRSPPASGSAWTRSGRRAGSARSQIRRDGGLSGLLGAGRPHDDVLDRIGAGQCRGGMRSRAAGGLGVRSDEPGRRAGGRGRSHGNCRPRGHGQCRHGQCRPGPVRAAELVIARSAELGTARGATGVRRRRPLAPAARDRARPGRRVREFPAPGRPADRLEEHPAGGVAGPGPGSNRSPSGRPPARTRRSAWTRWALDAPLMMVRRGRGPGRRPPGVSFRNGCGTGAAVVGDREPPTVDDLAYHLTTLFPQVRPRGHLEVRYLDAQPGPWWTGAGRGDQRLAR